MALTLCTDLSAADWIVGSDLPWTQLVGFGPAGFASYARLLFLPDPAYPGQSENDVEPDDRPDPLPVLLEVLATRTSTPDDCYFCVWEGFSTAQPGSALVDPPKVVVPNRAYWLFRGPLTDLGAWDFAAGGPGSHRLHGAAPAFVWPADRAWCVAFDVDPHWAGVGARAAVITELVADPRLDVVPADPAHEQPFYS